MLGKPANRLGEGLTLGILTDSHQFTLGLAVIDSGHVLLDDWTLIQVCCHKVSGGTNQLHTPCVCLGVWICSLEARQEGVVNVYDATGKLAAEFGGENLHEAG